MVQTLMLKVCPLIFVGVLGACGGGEDDTTPPQKDTVLTIPERSPCMTTVPVPPDCQKK